MATLRSWFVAAPLLAVTLVACAATPSTASRSGAPVPISSGPATTEVVPSPRASPAERVPCPVSLATASAEPINPPGSPPRGQGVAPLLDHGDRGVRTIAITIDDGFSPAAVLADLSILEREHVNATWFPIGHVAAASPAVWRKVAAAGFPIANHTYDHNNLTRHSFEGIVADIRQDNAVLSAIVGEPLLPVVRPPGGAWNATVLAAAAAAGECGVVRWDITTGDTGGGSSDVAQLVRNGEQGRPGSLLLMHANLPYAEQALPAIIAFYRARGYTFFTLGQMFGIGGPVPFSAAP
jgi:peptidoglycan/xylan/chitin deacetylase (PgdA/CDA1 family)